MFEYSMVSQYAPYIVGGLFGSLCKSIIDGNGHLAFPKPDYDEKGKFSGISLGFFGTIIIGVTTAIVVDHSFVVAIFSALGGSYVLEKLSQRFCASADAFFETRTTKFTSRTTKKTKR